jgi:ATP-dependent Lon protease
MLQHIFRKDESSSKQSKNKMKNKLQKKRIVESSSDEDASDTDEYETMSESEADSSEDTATTGSDYIENSEDNDDTDEDEDEDEDEEEKSPKYKKQKTRSNKKKYDSSDEDDDDSSDEDDDDSSDEDENEDEKKFGKMMINMLKRKAQEVVDTEEGKTKKSRTHKSKNKKKTQKSPKKSKKSSKKKEKNKSDEDEDEDDDEEYDDEEEEIGAPGIILSLDGFGTINNDEADFQQMKNEDKDEKCDSGDEKMFMKESYKPFSVPDSPQKSPTSTERNNKMIRKKKNKTKKDKTTSSSEEKCEKSVEEQYKELVETKQDLSAKLEKNPNNKIFRNAIKECRKSITELVKRERQKNTEAYFKLVHKDPKDKKNTNEMSFFKKKLSNKEQIRVMKDLKEINEFTNTDKPYRLALLESDIPAKFKAIALQKLNVLKAMDPGDSEYYKIKNWVDGFMRVPYGIYKNLSVSLEDGKEKCNDFIKTAKNTLDSCTYGLNDAKIQILQMVGQWISNPNAMGTAIAIKGPPGTGKTTLVKDGISQILGREFAFIALGGTSDASFMEGHSYTYEGSTWGKIVSILMESKCMNPVIYFDELDKISDTAKGEEIASILTHLTDTTQNNEFHDKYFSEVNFDLSKCLFIFSYNDESKVNPILKDRMYRIQTKGYEAKEKIIIARKHLLPKIREQVNFDEDMVIIPDETLEFIIGHPNYCKEEQGVRNLKRCLEIIHTKLNLFRIVDIEEKLFENDIKLEVSFPFTVRKKDVEALIKTDDPLNQSMLAMYV